MSRAAAALTGMGLTLLAACGGGETLAPEVLAFGPADGTLAGSYDPAQFSPDLVRAQLRGGCIGGQIGSYAETGTDRDGRITFVATCPSGLIAAPGPTRVERRTDGTLMIRRVGA
ncbi:hypothetical protein [Mesobacterium pallidum]|uniref:hypothetical protein n=1 Tax=Mesobacterium pallidum TaxID=2872037 RepID=UPI001EE33E0A|nr:hypothetical protein [Mesobacterium pallidum]